MPYANISFLTKSALKSFGRDGYTWFLTRVYVEMLKVVHTYIYFHGLYKAAML